MTDAIPKAEDCLALSTPDNLIYYEAQKWDPKHAKWRIIRSCIKEGAKEAGCKYGIRCEGCLEDEVCRHCAFFGETAVAAGAVAGVGRASRDKPPPGVYCDPPRFKWLSSRGKLRCVRWWDYEDDLRDYYYEFYDGA